MFFYFGNSGLFEIGLPSPSQEYDADMFIGYEFTGYFWVVYIGITHRSVSIGPIPFVGLEEEPEPSDTRNHF